MRSADPAGSRVAVTEAQLAPARELGQTLASTRIAAGSRLAQAGRMAKRCGHAFALGPRRSAFSAVLRSWGCTDIECAAVGCSGELVCDDGTCRRVCGARCSRGAFGHVRRVDEHVRTLDRIGDPTGGAGAWNGGWSSTHCSSPFRLYCLQRDFSSVLSVEPAEGRLAFVSNAPWSPQGGLTAADARCNQEAFDPGLTGTRCRTCSASTSTSPAMDNTRACIASRIRESARAVRAPARLSLRRRAQAGPRARPPGRRAGRPASARA